MRTTPPGSPRASRWMGGQPVPAGSSTATPNCRNPSTRSWMGRSRMRCTPSSTKWPRPARHNTARHGTARRRELAALVGWLPCQTRRAARAHLQRRPRRREAAWRSPRFPERARHPRQGSALRASSQVHTQTPTR
eukprot:scaffold6422_cov350-Prasinococcus_capsulatus_cf.AAC.2